MKISIKHLCFKILVTELLIWVLRVLANLIKDNITKTEPYHALNMVLIKRKHMLHQSPISCINININNLKELFTIKNEQFLFIGVSYITLHFKSMKIRFFLLFNYFN